MAYHIEFAQPWSDRFYAEFVVLNKNTDFPIAGDGVDFRMQVSAPFMDYDRWNTTDNVVASTAGGQITEPETGVQCVSIPFSMLNQQLDGYSGLYDLYLPRTRRTRYIPFRFIAVPEDPDFTSTLVTGTISIGDRLMGYPRIRLSTYPLFPNSATAVPAPPLDVEVSQVKQQLVSLGALDQVEQALTGGPTDPAVISWTTGGPVSINGPLYNVIAAALGYTTLAMTLFLTAASQRLI